MPFYQILVILIAAAAIDWLVLRAWRRWKMNGRLFTLPRINKTWIPIAGSIALVAASAAVNDLDYPSIDNPAFSTFLKNANTLIRLDVDHRENTILAVILLIGAGFLFAFAYRGLPLPAPRSDSRPEHPARKQDSWIHIKLIASFTAAGIVFTFLIIRMFRLTNSLLDPLLWIAAAALAGYGIACLEMRQKGSLPAWKIKRIDLVIVLALMAFGLLVASYKLETHPDMLYGDEGNFYETANAIAKGEYEPSLFDLGVYSYPVAGSYWQGLVIYLFGPSLWSWRFASVLIGIMAVFPLYFLSKEMFGRRLAVLACVAYLSAPYFLAFSRLGYNNSQVLLPVCLSGWFFFKGWKNESLFFQYLAGAAAGLGFLTYTAARISLILGIILLSIWIIRAMFLRLSRAGLAARFYLFLAFILGWVLAASPHLIFGSKVDRQSFRYKTLESSFFNLDAADEYFEEREIFAHSPGWVIEPYRLYFNPKIYLWLFQRGFLRTALSYFQPGFLSDHFTTSPLPGPVASIFFLFGFSILLSRMRDKRSVFVLAWFLLVVILLSALNTFPPRETHMAPVIPVMAVIVALGMDSLASVFISFWKSQPHLARPAILAILLLSSALAGYQHYFSTISRTFRPDIDQVMNWAELANREYIPFTFITDREAWGSWKPFFVGSVIPDKPFKVISEDDFLNGRAWPIDSPEAVYFFHEKNLDAVAAKLKKDFNITRPPIRLKDAQGMTIGGMLIKGEFVWPVKTSIWEEIRILCASPAGWMALVFLILAGILTIPFQKLDIQSGHRGSG